MNEAVRQMLSRYELATLDDHLRALREILQELALLGLWRSRFFEHAAFYGGTALRILHGLDRFSEDLDFSLLAPRADFVIDRFTNALETELRAFGFEVTVEQKIRRSRAGAIQSAFLKTDTLQQLIEIRAPEALTRAVPRGARIRIRLEIDTSAARIRHRDSFPAGPDSVPGAGLRAAGSLCREDARAPVSAMEDAREGQGLVRLRLVCRASPRTAPGAPSGPDGAEWALAAREGPRRR